VIVIVIVCCLMMMIAVVISMMVIARRSALVRARVAESHPLGVEFTVQGGRLSAGINRSSLSLMSLRYGGVPIARGYRETLDQGGTRSARFLFYRRRRA
jgi:hypothetical protein